MLMIEMSRNELKFFDIAKRYVSLWTRDHRNTNNPERIMLELAKVRNELYEAYKLLEAEDNDKAKSMAIKEPSEGSL